MEYVVRKAVEPIPREIMDGYGIVDSKPTHVGLYFLYKMLTTNQ